MKELFSIKIDISKLKEALDTVENIDELMAGLGFDTGNLKEANKNLKEHNKELSKTLKFMSLIKMVGKGLLFGAGALGLTAAGIKAMYNGAIDDRRTARQLGIDNRRVQVLKYAEEQLGTNGSLTAMASRMQYMLMNPSQLAHFSALGMNTTKMKEMSPEQLIQYTLKTLRDNMQAGMPIEAYLKEHASTFGFDVESMIDLLTHNGLEEFVSYLKEGNDILPRNYETLAEGEKAMNKLTWRLRELAMNIANKLAPAIEQLVNKLSPFISVLSDWLGKKVEGVVDWGFKKNSKTGKSNFESVVDNICEFVKNIWDWLNENKSTFQAIGDAISLVAKWIQAILPKKNIFEDRIKQYTKSGNIEGMRELYQSETNADNKRLIYNRMRDAKFVKIWEQQTGKKWSDRELQNWMDAKIDDGVITKDGKVIKINQNDNILATKSPIGNMLGNSYTININANVRHDRDVANIKYQLTGLLDKINAGAY